VENYGYRVGTGFLSTPFLLPVLTEAGRLDVAYKMLENEQSPGWLAEVNAGATTVWEDWDGKASRNHYSPGAVCEWLFASVAGIHIAGENLFEIRPNPGGSLTYARAEYKSIFGKVVSSWKKTNNVYQFKFSVPANTTAKIVLPDGVQHEVSCGEHTFVVAA
jgi:alpha-L-rhamnosidase